jgi:hypothetical protein
MTPPVIFLVLGSSSFYRNSTTRTMKIAKMPEMPEAPNAPNAPDFILHRHPAHNGSLLYSVIASTIGPLSCQSLSSL